VLPVTRQKRTHPGVVSLKKNSGNAQFERRRREDRGAEDAEGGGAWGVDPSAEFFGPIGRLTVFFRLIFG